MSLQKRLPRQAARKGPLVRVKTTAGWLEGQPTQDGLVCAFRGIPYAAPPVGQLRWRPPEQITPWDGTRSAISFGPVPVQPPRPPTSLTYLGPEPMCEDCLYLNVWTAAAADERSPVIVFFHFGAYLMGSGSGFLFDGEALARRGVVIVTFNFRLGRFGFLAHPELSAESTTGTSGNYGLLDQIAALEWVRDNIAAFGGDPGCVTIMGESSGSASVSILMASVPAQGLFHRAIGQSGGAFETPRKNPGWPGLGTLADSEVDGIALCASVGAASVRELREMPVDAILTAFTRNDVVNWRQGLLNPAFLCGYPVADGHVLPAGGLVRHYAAGKQATVPLLTGFNAKEGGGKFGPRNLNEYRTEAETEFGELARDYYQAYPAEDDATARQAASVAIGDKLFSWQNWAWASLHASSSREPVFFYHFSHVPPYPVGIELSETEGDPATELGAIHGAEIPYVFGNLDARSWPWTRFDRKLSETMSRYWLEFARTGDPNSAGQPRWEPFVSGRRNAMIFGDAVQQGLVPAQERLSFWDSFYGLPG